MAFQCICFLILILLYIKTRKYNEELLKELNGKEHRFKFLYPMSLYIYNIVNNLAGNKQETYIKNFRKLYVTSKTEILNIFILHRCKQIAMFLLFVIIANFFSVVSELEFSGNTKSVEITRNPYDKGGHSQNLVLQEKDKEEQVIDIEVSEVLYSKQELEIKMEEAINYVDSNLKGKNPSLDQVDSPLYFPSSVENNGIQITYTPKTFGFIDQDGGVNNEDVPKEGQLTQVLVSFTYKDEVREKTYPIRIIPKTYTKQEELFRLVKQKILDIELTTRNQDKLILPETIEGVKILEVDNQKGSAAKLIIMGIVLGGLLAIREDELIKEMLKKRDRQLIKDYPDFINRLVLLLGAGMTLKGAVTKLAMDYKKKKEEGKIKSNYTYEELLTVVYEIQSGIAEGTAYQHYGSRIGLAPYIKFSNILVQNLSKGGKNITDLLEQESVEAFEKRKESAKRLGEEAGTKLLFPMLLLLMVVLLLVMYPALVNFSI